MGGTEHGSRADRLAFLAYAYLAVIRADCETHETEVKHARERLAQRVAELGGSESERDVAWTQALEWRMESGAPNLYLPNVGRFMAEQPRDQRIGFLEDLVAIAAADRRLRSSELQIVAELTWYLGFRGEVTLEALRNGGALRLEDAEGEISVAVPGLPPAA